MKEEFPVGENKEYLTMEKENGSVNIAEDVVASIAALAVQEVEGVCSMNMGVPSEFTEFLNNKKNPNKGVKLTMDGDDIIIDCNVILYYGNSIAEIARAIQEKVAASVQAMTGLSVKKVNVHVGGINLAKKEN